MRIGLMVEGQNGLTWERWAHILELAERLEFPSLFRSDHYFIQSEQESLEAYLSFVMAAERTSTIRFGPLVSPVTFRHPSDIGRMSAQIDALSGGRFVMGLGAGWNEAEHRAYGLGFPPTKERFDRLEEAIQVIRALWEEEPASFDGRYFRLEGANPHPKPARAGGPPLLIGGAGERRTLRLVAQYAAEWNAVNLSPEVYAEKTKVLAGHCKATGREPGSIARSMMAFGIIGPSGEAVDFATRKVMSIFGARDQPLDEFRRKMRERGMIVGSTDEVVDTLGRLAESGLQEVMFQHFDFDSDDVPEYLANEIAPRVAGF